MRRLLILVFLLAWAGAAGPGMLRAQSNPPFQNPSLDSNCYFPQIGDPSEMDTIVGSVPNQYIGDPVIKNMGLKPDGSFGNMLIGNLVPPPDQNSYNLSQVATGPGFNLHQMKQYLQKFDPSILTSGYRLAHLRDRNHLDIFANWRIYWADDNGNYDSARYTTLGANIRRGNTHGTGVLEGPFPWYITHLTSDTVDDIVLSAYTDVVDTFPPYHEYDTAYALLYRGGQQLYGKDTAYEDTSAYLFPIKPYVNDILNCTQADFRGVGRDDLIVSYGNMMYYRNDPPFSLEKFVEEITTDTIYSGWQYHEETGQWASAIEWAGGTDNLPMRGLPKKMGDRSVDFVSPFKTTGDTDIGIFFFRGGPNFGSHILRPDSSTFVITHPSYTFGTPPDSWLYFPPQDAGDMTGTGNHLILVEATNDYGDAWWDNFYVTGKALDNKIDIWNTSVAAGGGDTLTANADSLEDFLMGRPGWPGIAGGSTGQGTLQLLYGTKQIPLHLDSQWADVKNISTQNGVAFTLSPNPTRLWSVATIVWPEAEDAEYEVYNLLGSVVQSGTIRMLGGAEQERIYFPNLASGVYEVLIHGSSHEARARLVIVR